MKQLLHLPVMSMVKDDTNAPGAAVVTQDTLRASRLLIRAVSSVKSKLVSALRPTLARNAPFGRPTIKLRWAPAVSSTLCNVVCADKVVSVASIDPPRDQRIGKGVESTYVGTRCHVLIMIAPSML